MAREQGLSLTGPDELLKQLTKTVLTENAGQVEIEVPRDRAGRFEPQIVRKRQRQLNGVDEIVLSLYAKGLTASDSAASNHRHTLRTDTPKSAAAARTRHVGRLCARLIASNAATTLAHTSPGTQLVFVLSESDIGPLRSERAAAEAWRDHHTPSPMRLSRSDNRTPRSRDERPEGQQPKRNS